MLSRIRSILFSIYLSLATVLVGGLGLVTLVMGTPGARLVTRTWAKSALFGLRWICGLRFVIERPDLLPKGAAIVASNHQSMWETIVFFALAEKPAMVFKKELLRVPIYGWYGHRAGSIPIDREAGAKAIKELTALAAQRIAEGCQIIIFPEGSRAPPGGALPLQPGVAAVYKAANAPVTPALHDSGRCWKAPGGLFSLKTPGVVTLRFLPPIEAGLDRKEFQRRLDAALEPRFTLGLESAAGEAPASAERSAA